MKTTVLQWLAKRSECEASKKYLSSRETKLQNQIIGCQAMTMKNRKTSMADTSCAMCRRPCDGERWDYYILLAGARELDAMSRIDHDDP